jgi:anti-sigma B factor antagonist
MAPEGSSMHVEVKHNGTTAYATPLGDIGTHEAPALRQAIREALEKRPARLIVDLTGVPYMATAGLATLVEAMNLTRKSSTSLVLAGMHDRVKAVFDISKLTPLFRIAPSVADAENVS